MHFYAGMDWHMRIVRLALKRLAFAAPQVLGITFVAFIMLRLLPGNPAYVIAGQFATRRTHKAY